MYQVILFITLYLISISATDNFDPNSVKKIIIENDKNWGEGSRNNDLNIVTKNYAKDAIYLPDDNISYHGFDNIKAFWQASLPFVKEIILNLETLEGSKEILYETGTGKALIKYGDESNWQKFKYVNVWRLQKDGSYKIVIDTFNKLVQQ